MPYDVIGLGLCTHDYIGIIPRMPSFEDSVRMGKSSEQGGGPAATAIVTASKLGAKTGFLAKVGDDQSGQFIIDNFQKYNVDTSSMVIQPGETSHKIVVLVEKDTGKRAFISNDASVSKISPEEININLIRSARFLHIDATNKTTLFAAKEASKNGTKVVLDIDSPNKYFEEVVSYVDILIPSRFFYRDMFNKKISALESARKLLHFGPEEVIITLGENGSACADQNDSFYIDSFSVEPVIDTTGCGDVFHGGYIYGKMQGWDMKKTVQFASAVAALKCKSIGGRKGIPTLKENLEFLKKNLPDEW